MALGLCLAAASVVGLFHSMNALMDVGGYCAEGGAYVIRQHCPTGTVWTFSLSLVAGMVGLRAYMTANSTLPGPHLVPLVGTALLLSMGVPFLMFGLDTSLMWITIGGITCAAAFLPLLLLVRSETRRQILWADVGAAGFQSPAPPATAASTSPDDLAESLARISGLHDSGALTEAEFAAAKARILGGGTS